MATEKKTGTIPPPCCGFKRIFRAFCYSCSGFHIAWQEEAAFRQICILFCIILSLALLFAQTWGELIILLLPSWICIIVELLNTAIENIVDMFTDKWHPLAKKAKDLGSAAQFASQILVVFIWLSFFIYRFY